MTDEPEDMAEGQIADAAGIIAIFALLYLALLVTP